MKNRSKQITAVGNSLLARLAGIFLATLVLASVASQPLPAAPADPAHNPLIWADVPDISVMRVGTTYYMSSTTMHMSPGLPIMKSADLVNWRMASYAYETLVDNEAMRLENGKNAYSKGSWASSLRYHDGVFYVSTFSYTSGYTHIYSTRDPEHGPWKETHFEPALHDNSLFFDDDGHVYMVSGGGRITLTELQPDLSGIKPGGVNKVLIENVNTVFGSDLGGLNGEGSQLFKINGRYYLFNIASPGSRWARTVIVHRADSLTGPYEGRIALDDRGIAQGGLIDTPEGKWYAYLFKDNGAVGRIPYLVPVTWKDGWPVLGGDGKVPMKLDIPAGGQGVSGVSGIVAFDEFDRRSGDPDLPLAWQWNHNPDNKLWSVTQRPGYLRLTTGRIDADLPSARNTLTQRTFGPSSSATTSIDVSGMKDGDYAGLAAFQRRYGFVGVKMSDGARTLVMVSADSDKPEEIAAVPLSGKTVHLKVECEFEPAPEVARFSYSLDGRTWIPIGRPSALKYTVPHFMGYRFALFYYATKTAGGRVDFDYFRIGEGGGSPVPSPTLSADAPATRTSLPPLAPRAWITSGPLVHPTADTNHPIVAVKDPSVVFHNGRWHIFATTAGSNGWGMAYFSFADWDKAPEAKPFYLDQNPNLAGYNCAPQTFYFRPQKKWYMIFQSQQPRFSTTDNIEDPMSWSAPQDFFKGTPKSVVEGWLDYFIICDDTHAYLFFPDDHGRMYRSRTPLADFPRGFDEPVVVLHEAKNDLFEGSCVYRLKGTNQYLMLVECIGKIGTRYYRAWMADRLDGEWKPLPGADSEATPFAGDASVRTSDGSPLWAEGISHGELLRDGYDETLTVDPQNLRFLYQGLPVGSHKPDYVLLPYRLGLLKPSLATPLSASAAPVPDFHDWAATPPMGWNSWDSFGTTVTEAQTKANADFMAAKLKAHGWQYVVVDIEWYQPTATGHGYVPGAKLVMDKFGRLLPAVEKFPAAADGAGFKPLADYVHAKGLKFGIHLMRGIPRQAVTQNTPVLGSDKHAADIADTSSICSWNPDMYGVDVRRPGGQEYYDSLLALYAGWGVDFIKVDDISRPYDEVQKLEIEAIRRAITKTGRPIVFSLSPGETPLARGAHVADHANMWRISDDFWDNWPSLRSQFKRLHDWTPYRRAGAWPDADMLPLGRVEFGRQTHFSRDEQFTLMTLWSIARSPLILGADMTKLDEATLALLTNDEVLAVNQRSENNRQLFRTADSLIAWVADIPGSADKYVALFNAREDYESARKLQETEVIDRHTPGQGVELDADITGAKTLHLMADDAGDGITGDHVVWSDPRLTGPAGELRLTKQGWLSASTGWGSVAVGKDAAGGPLSIQGKPVADGIGAHAPAHLAFAVPPGYTRFRTFAALDDVGVGTPYGATVRFRVLASDTAVTTSATVRVPLADLGFSGKVKVRDLWSHADLAPASGEISAEVPAHGARLFRVGPQN